MKQPILTTAVTVAEILKQNGYKTVSYNGGGQVSGEIGFSRGFDVYDSLVTNYFSHVVKNTMEWIGENREGKYFLFLHTYEVHHPYTPDVKYLSLFETNYSGRLPPKNISKKLLEDINSGKIEIDERDKEHIINTYDAEIRSMDEAFGTLCSFLKESNLYDNTLIILSSDHGEEFGEHGMMGWHSHTLYDEIMRVPLIIKFPKSKFGSGRVREQTRGIDILPTLLHLLNIPVPSSFEGTSLMGLVRNQPEKERPAISEQDTPGEKHPASIRTKKWKLYESKLFDLEKDPREMTDVSAENKATKDSLAMMLNELLKTNTDSNVTRRTKVELDARTIEQLRSLGYVK